MTNNETLADILAEMRLGSVAGIPCAYRIGRPNLTGPIRIDNVTIGELADRIEAAEREREMAKEMSKKLDGNRVITGNAAALREALEEIVNHHCINCPENTQYGCGVNIGGLLGFKCDLLKRARAALAAPPRNCDRFAKWHEAIGAFLASRGATHRRIWSDECDEFIDWLFAPAEGGAE